MATPAAPIAIASIFNDGYVAEMLAAYRRDPASVDESWRQYFRLAETLGGGAPAAGTAPDPDLLRKTAAAMALAQGIRQHGHYAVALDPLGAKPLGAAELTPEFYGITEADLQLVPGSALGFPHMATAKEVVDRLRLRYETAIGIEYQHLSDEGEREWFRQQLIAQELFRPLTKDEALDVLRRLTMADGLERFLAKAYVGYKRFSIEGTDALIPMLDHVIAESAAAGAREVAIGMAHRGRLNVLVNILGKAPQALFEEFEGRHPKGGPDSGTGDVKYHMGAEGRRAVAGRDVKLRLLPNPSHLEFVNPVLNGLARADQRTADGRDERAVVPVVIHGDAAFPGEGIVPETFNLSRLRGFRVGGTVHIIVNNQIGFTTNPTDARSTHYASDLAKGFEVPVLHVNADRADACIAAVRVACAYRAAFGKDVVIDLVGYRRHGHNEGDEPTYTQPVRYGQIKAHPTPPQVWGRRLVAEGHASEADVATIEREVMARWQQAYDEVKQGTWSAAAHAVAEAARPAAPAETGVAADVLGAINERLLTHPADFTPHPRLWKQLERRREALGPAGGIDWGHAEALAFGSLLLEGTSVRLVGQDAERGTFSHRHAVLNDANTNAPYTPLQHLPNAAGRFEVYPSALSETAVMGFEYGYSVAAADTLALWEAQFGDFANVAQPIIDQFIAADRSKWHQDSSLVLLLPHGYEGQGPEHSSARLERFLQLCAEDNLRVCYPSSPAQYFHVLRRQARWGDRRPLVLMQPKSMLRLPAAMSALDDLVRGTFRHVIDDPRLGAPDAAAQVRRVVFCTGKVYYDLVAKGPGPDVALVRVEQLYPWPAAAVAAIVDRYPNVEDVVWAQEEPKNAGAWTFVAPRLRVSTGNALELRYVGRPDRASPAEGYASDHAEEQARLVAEALEVKARRKAGARA
ncbi:MAG: 2-oxoglutarate dehydrogenase E1 component [Gemmatimonadaceae bacterium]|nr:2-oxoglutarate dehydrogenase E1 component [Gemmatimonadaceae bacterium]